MTRYHGLLRSIARSLGVLKGLTESENAWKSRIVYSVLGKMALASLWDVQDENEPVSITHFKRRMKQLAKAFFSMYPEIRAQFLWDIDELFDEIYEIYVNTGHIYHSPYRISPAAWKHARHDRIIFQRGLPVSQNAYMSGIGMYQISDDRDEQEYSVQDMFHLSVKKIVDDWNRIVSDAQWTELHAERDVEYLRTRPPFKWGYWEREPDCKESVSMLRIGEVEPKLYYLYKFEEGKLLASQLPYWMVENYRYRMLSSGCLYSLGTLPPTKYQVDGDIVHIKIGYLLPPMELNFIKLYSWPESFYSLPSDFSRIMDKKVFFAVKKILEQAGFAFVEE